MLDPALLGFGLELHHYDLSLANRQATANAVVRDAAAAMRETGLGLKAATVTPEVTGDVGSPNRILREGVGGSVIVRTGRRIPGVAPPAPVVHPIVVVRMAVGDAYGAEEGRTGPPGGVTEQAWRTERIDRSVCRSVAEFSFRTASQLGACVYGGPKWTVSTVYEGMLKEEMDSAARRYPDITYRPTLIDAAYAGLITESSGSPLVVPALNRDGDCLSDLVLALFGSIAGAESVLLALDDELHRSWPWPRRRTGRRRRSRARTWPTRWPCSWPAPPCSTTPPDGEATVAAAAAAIRRATLGAAARRRAHLRPWRGGLDLRGGRRGAGPSARRARRAERRPHGAPPLGEGRAEQGAKRSPWRPTRRSTSSVSNAGGRGRPPGAAVDLGVGDWRRDGRRGSGPDRVGGHRRLGRVVLAPVDQDPAPAQATCACWRRRGRDGRSRACGPVRGPGTAAPPTSCAAAPARRAAAPSTRSSWPGSRVALAGQFGAHEAGHHATLDDGGALAGVEVEDHVVRRRRAASVAARRATTGREVRWRRGWRPRPASARPRRRRRRCFRSWHGRRGRPATGPSRGHARGCASRRRPCPPPRRETASWSGGGP